MTWVLRLIRAGGAGLVLLVLIAGVPLLLASTIGNPLHGWDALRVGDISDAVLIDLLAALAYLFWAQFTIATLSEVLAHARRLPTPGPIPGLLPAAQHLAHALVAAALLSAPTLTTLIPNPTPGPAVVLLENDIPVHGALSPAPAGAHAAPGDPSRRGWHTAGSGTADAQRVRPGLHPERRVLIERGGPSTYWDLAHTHLGRGERWREIWSLNQGRRQDDGTLMSAPNYLQPGWLILLPHTTHTTDTTDTTDIRQPERRPSSRVLSIAPVSAATTLPPTTGPSTSASSPSAPVVDASAGNPAADGAVGAGGPEWVSAPVSLLGMGFGGGLLSGLSLAALSGRRRRQQRHRRPGHCIPTAPPHLRGLERALRTSGDSNRADAVWVDQALRGLAHSLARTPGARLPDLIAARLTDEHLHLYLTHPTPGAPASWQVDGTGRTWTLGRADATGYQQHHRELHFAPYPALVSIAHDHTPGREGLWLLDLEHLTSARLTGDPRRCLDLARHISAELALTSWSEQPTIDLVGFGSELARLNPDRLHHHPYPHQALTTARARHRAARDVLDRTPHSHPQPHHLLGHPGERLDVLTGRLRDVAADMWMPHILLIADPPTDHPTTPLPVEGQHPLSTQRCDLGDLVDLVDLQQEMVAYGRRTGVAVITLTTDTHPPDETGHPAVGVGWDLNVDAEGTLTIPGLDLRATAVHLSGPAAQRLTQLLDTADSTQDVPAPASQGQGAWDAMATVTGAPRTSKAPYRTVSASHDARHEPTPPDQRDGRAPAQQPDPAASASDTAGASVLARPARTYVRRAATTARDVETLAPNLPDKTRQAIRAVDPGLDEDLRAWHDPDCSLPRLTLLGPVDVRAHGSLPPDRPRKPWNVEVVTYLATHPRGVTAEQLGTDLWPDNPDIATKPKLRQSISITRRWLGTNPRTGYDHLPPAQPSRGGPALYRVDDILIDAELFRRLRLRGTADNRHGITDLTAALDLVTGPPLSQRRPGGYGWLTDTPLDHDYIAMIVDVAHLVATHHLAERQPQQARTAAETALKAGSTDDIALLDLIAACDAEGNHAQANHYIKRIMINYDTEVEEDLPPRTAQILHRRAMRIVTA